MVVVSSPWVYLFYPILYITKSLRSPRTKVRGLCRLWDAQRAPRPKGRGFSKHVDIKISKVILQAKPSKRALSGVLNKTEK